MNAFLAPPELLAATAFQVEGDADLRSGLHLRILAGAGASFPVSPFAVYRVRGVPTGQNEGGRVDLALHPGDRRPSGSVQTFGRTPVRLTFTPTVAEPASMQMLDGSRVLATRSRGPWTFSMPAWRWVANDGPPQRLLATGLCAPDLQALHGELGDRLGPCLALPILQAPPAGNFAWYIGAERPAVKAERVGNGWPRRWGPRERHVFGRWAIGADGSLQPRAVPLDDPAPSAGHEADEERWRIARLLAEAPALDELVVRMLGDDRAPPWAQRVALHGEGRREAELNPLQFLQLGMADYGIARHAGYARCWGEGEVQLHPDDLLAVFAFIAFDPSRISETDPGTLRYTLERLREPGLAAQVEQQLLRAIAEDGLADDPIGDLQGLRGAANARGLLVAPFVTYTAPVTPYDPPAITRPQVVRRQWAPPVGRQPSDHFSAVFAFRELPLCSLGLLERQTDAGWVPRAGASDDGAVASPEQLLRPQVFGREVEAVSRAKELRISVTQSRAALLGDAGIPAAAPTQFRASASDLFGRYGQAVEFEVSAPEPRPQPAPPRLAHRYLAADPPPGGDGEVSPGSLHLNACFDTDDDHPAGPADIAVPSVAALPRGSLAINTVELALTGTVDAFGAAGMPPVALPPSATVTLTRNEPSATLALPALAPMARARLTLTGRVVDSANVSSEPAALTFSVTDPRAPQPLKTGVGLLWTTRPSAAPTVSIELAWDAPPLSRHLVFLGDERTLLPLDDEPQARSARGVALCQQAAAHVGARYQRVTADALTAGNDGRVSYTLELPRTLETVQVVRVVPLGPDGAQPPFGSCTTVPVAVPSSRRAAPAQLSANIDPVTGVPTLRLVADGLDLAELRREQPGLFEPGQAGTAAPVCRVRWSSGPVVHPMYAQVLAAPAGAVEGDDAGGVRPLALQREPTPGGTREWFEASFEGEALVPYVRHVFWAETRLPPERCVPADTAQVASGIRPAHAEAALPAQRLWGEASGPLVLMHAPPAPQVPADKVSVELLDAGAPLPRLKLLLAEPPKTSSLAVDSFRVAVWYGWGDAPLVPVKSGDGTPMNGRWPQAMQVPDLFVAHAPSAGVELHVHVAFIDPLGRLGPLTVVRVAGL